MLAVRNWPSARAARAARSRASGVAADLALARTGASTRRGFLLPPALDEEETEFERRLAGRLGRRGCLEQQRRLLVPAAGARQARQHGRGLRIGCAPGARHRLGLAVPAVRHRACRGARQRLAGWRPLRQWTRKAPGRGEQPEKDGRTQSGRPDYAAPRARTAEIRRHPYHGGSLAVIVARHGARPPPTFDRPTHRPGDVVPSSPLASRENSAWLRRFPDLPGGLTPKRARSTARRSAREPVAPRSVFTAPPSGRLEGLGGTTSPDRCAVEREAGRRRGPAVRLLTVR